jgi:RNase P protein component
MGDHETRRRIIREWMALPKDKRNTEEHVVAFAKKAIQQNEFHRSRRDPDHQFRRDPYQKLWDGFCLALGSRNRAVCK